MATDKKEDKAEVKKKPAPEKKEGAKRAKGSAAGLGYEVEAADAVVAKRRPRLLDTYHKSIVPSLMKKLEVKNPMQVPRLECIIVNSSLKDAVANPKVLDSLNAELALITGQKPVPTRAKKAIAAFKLRKGIPVGARVTLRNKKMWEFFDRLVNVALPRVRDFRGISAKSFDGRGNYTLGIREQVIFPEISIDKIDKARGMNITFITSATSNEAARALLAEMGMPFRK